MTTLNLNSIWWVVSIFAVSTVILSALWTTIGSDDIVQYRALSALASSFYFGVPLIPLFAQCAYLRFWIAPNIEQIDT